MRVPFFSSEVPASVEDLQKLFHLAGFADVQWGTDDNGLICQTYRGDVRGRQFTGKVYEDRLHVYAKLESDCGQYRALTNDGNKPAALLDLREVA